MLDHVVRRGLEHPATRDFIKRAVEEGPKLKVPQWGGAVLFASTMVFVVMITSAEYTLRDVIATLAMVETPSAAITVSAGEEAAAASDDVKEGLLETGPEITLVRQKPITASIRGTLRHLVAEAGFLARWRGLGSIIVYTLIFNIVANIVDAILPRVPGKMVLVASISGAACANLHAAWTHKVIAAPAEYQGFFQRFVQLWGRVPSRTHWRQLAPAAAVNSAAAFVALYIAQGWVVLLQMHHIGQDDFGAYSGLQWVMLVARFVSLIAIVFATAIFLILPAHVTQIRIEASILPEDKETIVPFDRTFDGKVVPQILGGTGAIGFLDAWRSFNWEARRRLIRLYVKITAIITLMFIAFAHVLAFELWAIMGSAVGEFMAKAQHEGAI